MRRGRGGACGRPPCVRQTPAECLLCQGLWEAWGRVAEVAAWVLPRAAHSNGTRHRALGRSLDGRPGVLGCAGGGLGAVRCWRPQDKDPRIAVWRDRAAGPARVTPTPAARRQDSLRGAGGPGLCPSSPRPCGSNEGAAGPFVFMTVSHRNPHLQTPSTRYTRPKCCT